MFAICFHAWGQRKQDQTSFKFACTVCSLKTALLLSQWILMATFFTKIKPSHVQGHFSLHIITKCCFNLQTWLSSNLGNHAIALNRAKGHAGRTAKCSKCTCDTPLAAFTIKVVTLGISEIWRLFVICCVTTSLGYCICDCRLTLRL